MTRPVISGIAPFFVARNAAAAVAFYRDKFGFDVICQEPDHDLFLRSFAATVRCSWSSESQ